MGRPVTAHTISAKTGFSERTVRRLAAEGKIPGAHQATGPGGAWRFNLDEGDKVLRQSITYRIVQALRLQWKRGKIASPEKRGGVRVWKYTPNE